MRIHFARIAGLLAALLVLGVAADAHALLSYTISSPLMNGCTGDGDNDCLSDALEGALAVAVVPWYYYDESEECSAAQDAEHYSRQDFFQVRPHGTNIPGWKSDGTAKWIQITYYFLHPHDCAEFVIFWGGHQGDGEKVDYHLYSYDLKTWYLSTTRYWHHNSPYHDFTGTYHANLAASMGTYWASVAADEDSHGSWPGLAWNDESCAGPEDRSWNDCFEGGNMYNAYLNHSEVPSVTRNIGGPSPELWNSSVLSVWGSTAWSTLDVGHGPGTEYWSYQYPYYQKFCGWECTDRKWWDGNCYDEVHLERSCSTGLHEKTDKYQYTLVPPPPRPPRPRRPRRPPRETSCEGYCGEGTGFCYYDDYYVQAGEFFFDYFADCYIEGEGLLWNGY